MPIRLTGMASGMDTEAMISEMVSAYRMKSQKYRKAQTKLNWKQDTWKILNTKVKNLYSSLTNMRFSTAYNLRSASISDATKATVSAGSSATNGTYSLEVSKMAKAGYLTGGKLNDSITKNSTLEELGINGNGTISVTTGTGATTDIAVNKDMKVSEFVDTLNSAGVKANFDEANHRIYVAAAETGKKADFSLTGADADGTDALFKLGLSIKSAASTDTFKEWAAYARNTAGNPYVTSYDSAGKPVCSGTYDAAKTKDYVDVVKANVVASSATYTNKTAQIAYADAYKAVTDADKRLTADEQGQMRALLKERNPSSVYVDSSGKLYELLGDGTYKSRDDDSIHTSDSLGDLTRGDASLAELESKAGLAEKTVADDGSISYSVNAEAVAAYQNGITTIAAYDIPDNAAEVADVQSAYSGGNLTAFVDGLRGDAKRAKEYVEDNVLVSSDTLTSAVIADKITNAIGVLDETITPPYNLDGNRVDGTDAEIKLNNVTYTSDKNDFSINGLNINVLNETTAGETVTISVSNNTQGLYDKIKGFLKEYNTLINDMTGKYNSPTTKGYEPLTNEEKDAMSDSEVEAWEKKLKDSVLRRDDSLEFLMSNMQTAMMKSYEVNGKKYSLSSFGISTLGIIGANENEEKAFHINGDKDDIATAAKPDKLMEALTSDPDSVTEFLKQLSSGVYDVVDDKMQSSSMNSFQTVYNDKEMAREYSDYTSTIKKWEDKLAAMEDSYYKKFAAMEKALSTLQSQQSSLASLLGS